ncbi:hypothetical protein HMPREF1981_01833 [Bacteroides pyogenes F0041]|uniref:Uncharacterized protein n=1 Tax=Bacteroides pyogenes F0041 TaxID=1321819 RepID=U2CMJ2_9BACE|nr:hypothetical protein HMPREF1981_01833 [Bacteroides pyogenes F0041]
MHKNSKKQKSFQKNNKAKAETHSSQRESLSEKKTFNRRKPNGVIK